MTDINNLELFFRAGRYLCLQYYRGSRHSMPAELVEIVEHEAQKHRAFVWLLSGEFRGDRNQLHKKDVVGQVCREDMSIDGVGKVRELEETLCMLVGYDFQSYMKNPPQS